MIFYTFIFPKVKISSLCIVKWDVKNELDIKGNIKALEYPQFFLTPKGCCEPQKVEKNSS